MRKLVIMTTLLICLAFCAGGCVLTDAGGMSGWQKEAMQELLRDGTDIDSADIQNIALPKVAAEKFPAVKKAFSITCGEKHYYAFAASPLGYKDAINLFVAIDDEKGEIMGVKVGRHNESPEYADYITREWFLSRFSGKDTGGYLNRVVLEATQPNDIVQVTGATVSSQAVINGVNAAMGAYREIIIGEEAPAVPLPVEGFVTEIKAGR